MVQSEKNRFTLVSGGQSVRSTPRNWDSFEVALSRGLSINKEITTELEFFSSGAELIESAFNSGEEVTLSLERLDNNWEYTDIRYFKADFSTYSKNGGIVSVGFIEESLRELIEDNKGTSYDIDITNEFKLSYSGIQANRTNSLRSESGACEQLSFSNWLIRGVKDRTELSDTIIFPKKSFYLKFLKEDELYIQLRIGKLIAKWRGLTGGSLMLAHCRPSGSGFNVVAVIKTFHGVDSVADISTTFTDYTTHDIFYSSKRWGIDGQVAASNVSILENDFLCLFFNTERGANVSMEGGETTLSVLSYESSIFQDYMFPVIRPNYLISELMKKMCGTSPLIEYNLSETNWLPVFASSSCITRQIEPKITVSFEDLMKFLNCIYSCDYDLTEDTIRIDYASSFFSDVKAMDLEPTGRISMSYDDEHIYNKVEVGFDVDSDTENGTEDFLCKNVFEITKAEGETLDLVSPFKGSPYTIEQFIKDKASSSTTKKQSDDDVFVFCVNPFNFSPTGTPPTILFRGQTGVSSSYYNVPFSPMRMLIANSRYIGVSLWNKTKRLVFASTNGKSASSKLPYENALISEKNGENALLLTGLENPLFKPLSVEFDTNIDLWTQEEINDYLYKYFTVRDKKSGSSYDIYINDISLPLTKKSKQNWNALLR